MNNEQFRRLLQANAAKASPSDQNGPAASSDRSAGAVALGSKQRSSIPMTPRALAGSVKNSFAQQLAEREAANRPQKRLRTSAPKGSKLADGYVDRAKLRNGDDQDDRAARLQALEELFRKEEIDRETFERLQGEIAGGDLSSTHLVKGLDFKLLEKVRRGEDVFSDRKPASTETEPEPKSGPGDAPGAEVDFDDALGQLEEAEVHAVAREKVQKKGQLSTAPVAPGKKRTRDQILAELKAAREAAKAKPQSTLGSKFKKIGVQQTPGTRFERDSKGREVMIIVDEDGHEKRKVRKVALDETAEKEAFVPDKNAEVLGMEVPEFYRKKQEELDRQAEEAEVNIFDDAEEYDPLAGIESGSNSESSGDEESGATEPASKPRDTMRRSSDERDSPADKSDTGSGDESLMPPPRQPPTKPEASAPHVPRNYFQDSKTGLISEESRKVSAASDPSVLAALRKAKALNLEAKSEEEKQKAEQEERLKKMMRDSNRDADDMDMGFGTSRQDDVEDMEERDIKLSAWGDEDQGEGRSGGGKGKRKRGPKKRKGDVNSAADVLQALERRKTAAP